ncbi:hypothetical protein SAMN04488057_101377 [Cyclobacterium lianum]|uniref:6-bladed beta-propeller protein n=1 Tax=Cyclobacterium lianum TaxID=388280 RepID=A0A1M7ILH0_9BACT|nr:6-bladed beta-propeller [Cyclobacterium lianum]SHM41453.1 hypothetical protein SAMN04488057_101377 [Cyclobacterium lianum]
MKSFLNLILVVTALFFLKTCGEKEPLADNTLTINPHEADQSVLLSALVDSVTYIPLETNKNSLMARTREIIIKNKYIYAVDRDLKAVFVFDKKGKFVSKLSKHGSGPDEYGILYQVLVDEEEEYIEVFDYRGEKSRIIQYENITFEYLNEQEISLPFANTMRKEKDKDIYYFSAQQQENTIGSKITNADILVVKGGKIQNSLFDKHIITEGSTFSPNSESFTTNKQGDIFISLMYNNTFFRLSDMQAEPVLTVDFGNYGIDHSIGLNSTKEQQEYLYAGDQTKGLASFPVLNIYDSNITALTYYFKTAGRNQLNLYIHFKNTNQTFHTRDIINDLTNYPEKVYLSSYYYAVNHEVLHENYLVDIVLPWHSNEGKTIEIPGVGKIEPEDNPVIVMMKLKDKYIQ